MHRREGELNTQYFKKSSLKIVSIFRPKTLYSLRLRQGKGNTTWWKGVMY